MAIQPSEYIEHCRETGEPLNGQEWGIHHSSQWWVYPKFWLPDIQLEGVHEPGGK